MRKLLAELFTDLRQLEQRIGDITREIEAIASREDVARRLMTIPGIGALRATALLAAIRNGRQFQKARDLAAWRALYRGNFRPAEGKSFSASASGETAMCASSSFMELDHAFVTSTEQEIDCRTGWMGSRLEGTLPRQASDRNGVRHQIGMPVGFASEYPSGFIGIRNLLMQTPFCEVTGGVGRIFDHIVCRDERRASRDPFPRRIDLDSDGQRITTAPCQRDPFRRDVA